MASICPKCHKPLEDDAVCCATKKYTWKCTQCGKLSTGFVVPYGRCYMCGGKNQTVSEYQEKDTQSLKAIEEAVQFEIDSYHFYRIGWQAAKHPEIREVFEQMYLKEQDHLEELETKYHVHLDPYLFTLTPDADHLIQSELFQEIDLTNPETQVVPLYKKAIEMEKKTRDHFKKRAEELPPSPEKEIYRELAAEEEEHVSLLETELAQFMAGE